MKDESETRRHPTDDDLVAWVDAGIGRDGESSAFQGLEAHLAECSACRSRIAGLEALVAALRVAPPAFDPAELAARRTRVSEAVATMPRSRVVRFPRRAWRWMPLVAAAALAALVLARIEVDRPAAESTDDPAAATPLALIRAAQASAYEAAAAGDTVTILDPAVDPAPSPMLGDLTLFDEFEALPAAEQEAILGELAAMEFDL